MANDTIKTRIQMKNDVEANWNQATNFIPKKGEIIVYSPDINHNYSRLKIGDGSTTVINLPFIDSATISGININNIEAKKLQHTLTFGAGEIYSFDGSEDVTVPVYTGTII